MYVHIIIAAAKLVARGVDSGVVSPLSLVKHELIVVVVAWDETNCDLSV